MPKLMKRAICLLRTYGLTIIIEHIMNYFGKFRQNSQMSNKNSIDQNQCLFTTDIITVLLHGHNSPVDNYF